MGALTPGQQRTRARVEALIRLVAPGLNVVLAAGERLSRIVEPDDAEYYPVRPGMLGREQTPDARRRDGG